VPSAWETFSITWRFGQSTYEITIDNPNRIWRGVRQAELDGTHVDWRAIPLVDDGATHTVRVTMGN